MKKPTCRAARPLVLETQTVRTLTDDQLSIVVGGGMSELSCEAGCEVYRARR